MPYVTRNWVCPKCAKVFTFREWYGGLGGGNKQLLRAHASANVSQKLAQTRIKHQQVCPAGHGKQTGYEVTGSTIVKKGCGCLVLIAAAIGVLYFLTHRQTGHPDADGEVPPETERKLR
jgi:hypothetical protein